MRPHGAPEKGPPFCCPGNMRGGDWPVAIFLAVPQIKRHHILPADPAETCGDPAIATGGCFRIPREWGKLFFLKPMAPGLRRSAELLLALVDTGNAAASGHQRMRPFFHGQPHGCLDHFNDQPALGAQAFVLRLIRHSENPSYYLMPATAASFPGVPKRRTARQMPSIARCPRG